MNHLGNEKNCIFFYQDVKEGIQLNYIGSRWTPKDEEDIEKKYPMDNIIDQAKKLYMANVATILERNKLSKQNLISIKLAEQRCKIIRGRNCRHPLTNKQTSTK